MPPKRSLKDYRGFKIIKGYDRVGGRLRVAYNAYHPKAGNLTGYPSLTRLKQAINQVANGGYKRIGAGLREYKP